MLKFLDGPAVGKVLCCARAPLFLRVVVGEDGKIDALDQLDDKPLPSEKIHVYRMVNDEGTCHISYTDKQGRRRGRWERFSDYVLHEQQPNDVTVRQKAIWQSWALAERAKLLKTE